MSAETLPDASRSPRQALLAAIDAARQTLAAYLPRHVPVDRFLQLAKRAVADNPDLLECSTQSVLRAIAACASSGLPLDGRFSSLVVRRPKTGKPIAIWDPTFRGLTFLALESGHVLDAEAHAVFERDEFVFELGTAPRILHRPWIKGDRGPVVAAYAIAHLKAGGIAREILGRDDLEKIRASSPTPDKGPWQQWPDRMARKSALRRLLKSLPAADVGTLDRARQHVLEYDDGGESYQAKVEMAPTRPLPEATADLEARAIEAISEAGTLDVLADTWQGIRAEYRQVGADLPLAVEARWHERREALSQ